MALTNAMANMVTPNLFEFATSELSQDAILAYMIAWAKPECRHQHPVVHRLGERLLRSLMRVSAEAQGIADPLTNAEIRSLRVGVQRDCVDIWAIINERIVLIIEDKTKTLEHSSQIERYCGRACGWDRDSDEPAVVIPVYVKTGNESRWFRRDADCGEFYRRQLLEVFDASPDTGNSAIEEFRRHLRRWEDETESYRCLPPGGWNRPSRALEGFYGALENWLWELAGKCDGSKPHAGWHYVPNAAGGFHALWWHLPRADSLPCRLYLQIENGSRLQIRAGSATTDGDKVKVSANLLGALFAAVQEAVCAPTFAEIRAIKAGRRRSGMSAAVCWLSFDATAETWLATGEDGLLDFAETSRRFQLAMDFVDAVSHQACSGR